MHKFLSRNINDGIVKLYEVLENDKYIVMVMELCEMGNIAEYVK